MLKFLGVDRVGIYLTSCSLEAQRILNYYSEKGGVLCLVHDCVITCHQNEENGETAHNLNLVLLLITTRAQCKRSICVCVCV